MNLLKLTISFFIIWMLIAYTEMGLTDGWYNIYYICDKAFHLLCVITIRQYIKGKTWRLNLLIWGIFLAIRVTLPIIAIFTNYQWINGKWVVGSMFFVMVILIGVLTYPDFRKYLINKEWLR